MGKAGTSLLHDCLLYTSVEYGFSSHAAFTRAFKEAYGISPEEYRKDWPMLNTCDKPELSMRYQLVDEGVPLIAGGTVSYTHLSEK